MNWQPLLAQVEEMMLESEYTLPEIKAALSVTDWQNNAPFVNEKWWFGSGKQKSEVTINQLLGIYESMGLDKQVFGELYRMKFEEKVKELLVEHEVEITGNEAQHDLVAELNRAVEEDAA